MEEKLFMKRQQEGLNVARRHKRRMKQKDARLGNGAEVRQLANLASRFVLSFFVGVGCGLGNESDKQQRQGERQQPS